MDEYISAKHKKHLIIMFLVIVMNNNVTFACLLDELMLCCVCYC
jgi:hypothetical protein